VVLKKTAKKHSGLGTASEWEALKRAAFDLGEMMKFVHLFRIVWEYASIDVILQFQCTHLLLIPLIILNMAGYFFSMRCVASPPSSRIMFGCQFSAFTHLSIHHQKSSSVSPRHENIENPEKIMQKKIGL
jgi:hypothetical protein